ncbi:MAG: acyl-CoA dehydrogenase family protein [Tepidiformaceae bacterium]
MDEQELIQAVRELSRTKFVERATAIDREGRFPKENVCELQDLGVTSMALPQEFGGLALSGPTQMKIIEEVAYGDGSTAVALNMHIIVSSFLVNFPPFPHRNAVLEDIGRNRALICGPGSVPSGGLDNRQAGFKAIDDGDDLVFNGKAGFASMSEGAKYTLLGGTVDRGEENEPDLAVTIPTLTTHGLKLMYNWDAMGLRGTASHDVVAEDVRIPKSEALVIPQAMLRAILEAQGEQSTAETQRRALGALGITAIWLGLAQAAFDFTLDYVKQRHGYLAGAGGALGNQPGYRSDQAWAQVGIGNMEHWLQSGRIMLNDCIRRIEEPFDSVQEFTRYLVRTVYHLRRMSEEVSQGAMKVCGAHAYVRNRPLERIFRDMVGGNVMAWKTDELQQTLGIGALGMPITFVGPAGT